MPLPAALVSRLAKRGLIQAQHHPTGLFYVMLTSSSINCRGILLHWRIYAETDAHFKYYILVSVGDCI